MIEVPVGLQRTSSTYPDEQPKRGTSKDKVVTTIAGAKASLEQALADLEHLPAFDSEKIAFAAHLREHLDLRGDWSLRGRKQTRLPDSEDRRKGMVGATGIELMTSVWC